MATTIYLSNETQKLARRLAERAGRSPSALFRELLEWYDGVPSRKGYAEEQMLDRLALLVDDEVFDRQTRRQRLSEGLVDPASAHPFGMEQWVRNRQDDPDREDDPVDAILVVGATMHDVLCRDERRTDFWKGFLKDAELKVLLQSYSEVLGDSNPQALFPSKLGSQETVRARREQVSKALRDFSAVTGAKLHVRETAALITYSAIVLSRESGAVDFQIQPYLFAGPQSGVSPSCKGPKFVIRTEGEGDTFDLLAQPLLELWDGAKDVNLEKTE